MWNVEGFVNTLRSVTDPNYQEKNSKNVNVDDIKDINYHQHDNCSSNDFIITESFNDELKDSVIDNLSSDEETAERVKSFVKDSKEKHPIEQLVDGITNFIETEAQKADVKTPILSNNATVINNGATMQEEKNIKKVTVKRTKADPTDIKISVIQNPVMEFVKEDELSKKVTPSFINTNNIVETPEVVSVIDPPVETIQNVQQQTLVSINQPIIDKYNWLSNVEKIANDLGFIIKINQDGNYLVVNTFKNNVFISPKSFRINLGTIIDDRIKIVPRGDRLPEDQELYVLFNNNELNVELLRNLFLGGRESLIRSSYPRKVYELNKIIDLSTLKIYGKARQPYIDIMYAAMQKSILREQNRFSVKLDKQRNIITLVNNRPYSDIKETLQEKEIRYIINISKKEISLCK